MGVIARPPYIDHLYIEYVGHLYMSIHPAMFYVRIHAFLISSKSPLQTKLPSDIKTNELHISSARMILIHLSQLAYK
ncbi:MAG: hypothetical protein APF84_09165 [Gracilibacter sp. BRH_c7a]|nr:MAG: hypothetical protein APF84_09165 [Gracilibacter sp. BRH_c7a]